MNICEKKDVEYNKIQLILSIAGGVIFIILLGECGKELAEAENAEKEKVIKFETKTTPQIDTLVYIKNGCADTTFVYNFKKN